MKSLLIATVFSCVTLSSFAGGPWLKKKNQGLLQFQTTLPAYAYSSLLNGFFIKDTQGLNRKVFNSDYSFYVEYGITDRLNVISTLPFKYVKTGELTGNQNFSGVLPEGDLFGLSNYQLALKYGILDKKVKLAVSVHSRWNTVSKDLDRGLATGYEANSFGLMAHLGRSSEKSYGFLEVGFHKYSHGFSDVLEFNLEHGWSIGEHWNVAASLNARHALENGDYYNENLIQTGLYPNNQSWMAISAKASYELESKWGFNAALPMVPIKFKYVGFNGVISLGVYKKF